MFWVRLLSGIVLLILIFATLIPGGYILAGFLLLLALISYRELMKACKLSGHLKNEAPFWDHKNLVGCFSDLEIIGYVGIIAYYAIMVFLNQRELLLVCVSLILIAFMFLYVFTFPRYNARQIMMSFFSVTYAPLMLSFIYLIRELPYGKYLVWLVFVSSWMCDTSAYCVGMLIGKHKLAPMLSPKKSIEGAIGGVVGAALLGGLYGHFVLNNVIEGQNVTVLLAVISAVGAVIAQVGDLAASAIKRNQEIKDYGKLIPGHGGVLDRFDSSIFTAPMVYLLTLLLIHG